MSLLYEIFFLCCWWWGNYGKIIWKYICEANKHSSPKTKKKIVSAFYVCFYENWLFRLKRDWKIFRFLQVFSFLGEEKFSFSKGYLMLENNCSVCWFLACCRSYEWEQEICIFTASTSELKNCYFLEYLFQKNETLNELFPRNEIS